MIKLHQEHYGNFKRSIVLDETWGGKNIERWWKYVIGEKNNKFPQGHINRQKLKEICLSNRYTEEECVGAVMAWGGQRRNHGRMLFDRIGEITPIIGEMRQGLMDPSEAYGEFDAIWQLNKPLGMGAAYFTKLIYFCSPKHNGYIMDQWTSKSVNLLCNEVIVNLTSGYVSKKNNSRIYYQFCNIIEEISKDMKISAEDVEMAMFSKGGRNKAAWRKYVVDRYKV
ncbi:MAG: hypothetical protein JKX71_11930 [Amylibacter sp.]|nr:hypothetical protein [Amylibacter sp.]